jgi:predicted small lipoprotein YifL
MRRSLLSLVLVALVALTPCSSRAPLVLKWSETWL